MCRKSGETQLIPPAAIAAEPVLARRRFPVPPDSAEVFARLYDQPLAPLLRQRGLRPAADPGRPTQPGYFTRRFAFDSLAHFTSTRQRLWDDKEVEAWVGKLAPASAGQRNKTGFPSTSTRCRCPRPRCGWGHRLGGPQDEARE